MGRTNTAVRNSSEPSGASALVRAEAEANPSVELIYGDCQDVMPALPAGAFDGCVCDPPYGIRMADWDQDVPSIDIWREVFRLLKPGAVLAAFSARRRYHELASAVQAAGFRVVDMAVWIYQTGRAPSKQHLRPAHEPILIAQVPGRPLQVGINEARIPWRDEADRRQAKRIDPLRAAAQRRSVYDQSLNAYGREPFKPNAAGRWPTTVMGTDDVLGEVSHIFRVPKVRDSGAHKCAKPIDLVTQIVRLFVPEGGVVLDPFAGSGPVGEAAILTGRKAVLIEMARAA